MSDYTTEDRQNIIRAIIALTLIILAALLVGFGKITIEVFVIIVLGVSTYYLGKSSDKGSIIN